jgi:hypothetical protein
VLQGVDCSFVEDDTLLEQKETSVHETITSIVENVSLFSKVSKFSAGVHNEDDNFLLMHVTLSSLLDNSLFFFFTLIGFLSVNIIHVKLNLEGVNKLNFLCAIACSILFEKLSDFIFSISEHHRSKKLEKF